MAEIVEFLKARLAEDEAVAGSATTGPWSNNDPMARDGVHAVAIDGYVADCNYDRMGPFAVHNATHIARHDPSRVLRDIAAKRELLDAFDLSQSREIPCDAWLLLKSCIYAMAAIWAEHPDFDPSWTVTE